MMTIKDLKYHANVLDMLQTDKNSVMVIHGGGVYGDKEKTIERWCENFSDFYDMGIGLLTSIILFGFTYTVHSYNMASTE